MPSTTAAAAPVPSPVPVTAAPTTGAPSAAPTNRKGALGKNEFLKLLIAQMKHQDPLNPTQGDQMAAQLAQFSSLEQLQQINGTLGLQQGTQQAVVASLQEGAALNTLGKTVVATGNQIAVVPGSDPRGVPVLAQIAGSGTATLTVTDAAGKVVGTRALGAVNAGELSVTLGDAGKDLPPGVYRYAVTVTGPTGAPVDVTTYTVGRIDRIQATAQGPVLYAGGIAIPLANVTEIRAG